MPKYGCAQHTYTTPVRVGHASPIQYVTMSLKPPQSHTDRSPNIHLHVCPNTGMLSTPTPLPSALDTPHLYSTSPCRPSLLNPMRTGHLTYTYMYAQIRVRVRSAHLHHSRLRWTRLTHTVPHHVAQASSIQHGWGTQHICIDIPK